MKQRHEIQRDPTLPPMLSTPDRAAKRIHEFNNVVGDVRDLAECGMIDQETAERIERDLRTVIASCFFVKLNS